MVTFIVDSDLHFTNSITPKKSNHVSLITGICKERQIDAVICPGDLTDNGWNGKSLCCWKYGGEYDQLISLKEQYISPISKYTNVYLCMGNHDTYTPWPYIHPVGNYIERRYDSLRYVFKLGDLHFVCLNIYPDRKGISFLNDILVKGRPYVLFFHYNLEGQWSDWWTEKEKEQFYETIKDYNIVAILVGHAHRSSNMEWRGINVISGASTAVPVCTYERGKLSVEFIGDRSNESD